MNIQSLSIVVPGGCPNNCYYCVSKTHREIKYEDKITPVLTRGGFYWERYRDRMNFARDNGCNTVLLTGEGEPLSNKQFLEMFGVMNRQLDRPFRWIEVQTSGVGLDHDMMNLLNSAGVSTISLSLASFNNDINNEYNQITKKNQFDIANLCAKIKEFGFNLRLSLNATDAFNSWLPVEIFNTASTLKADQLIFRVLYDNGDKESPVYQWINKHRANRIVQTFTEYIKEKGTKLEQLPFGAFRYSVDGISIVVDDDCMSEEVKNSLKYLVLRPNCKLYTKWDDKGSLLF